MWSWRYAALYAHYTCIGLVNGMLTQALMPYCLYVAHGQPNTCATVSTFVNLPWGYKLLYGMLADCVPICGLHRKPCEPRSGPNPELASLSSLPVTNLVFDPLREQT